MDFIISNAIKKAREVTAEYDYLFQKPLKFNCEHLLMSIVVKESIKVDPHPFQNNFCGMYIEDEYEKTLVYNSNSPTSRRNFTIAHELGHYFMHSHLDVEFVDRSEDILDTSVKEYEVQANAFAANLVVPDEIIYVMLKHKYTFQYMKKTISVSAECLSWRLVQYLEKFYNLDMFGAKEIVEDYKDFSLARKFNMVHHSFAMIFFLNKNNKDEILHRLRNNLRPVQLRKNTEGQILDKTSIDYRYWY